MVVFVVCRRNPALSLLFFAGFRSNDFFSLKNNSLRIGSKRSKPTHPFFLNSFFLSGVGFCPALLIDSGSLEILLGGGGGGGGISRRL